jgi:hypothetical protein
MCAKKLRKMRRECMMKILLKSCAIQCGKPAEYLRMACGEHVQNAAEKRWISSGEAVEYTVAQPLGRSQINCCKGEYLHNIWCSPSRRPQDVVPDPLTEVVIEAYVVSP